MSNSNDRRRAMKFAQAYGTRRYGYFNHSAHRSSGPHSSSSLIGNDDIESPIIEQHKIVVKPFYDILSEDTGDVCYKQKK